MSNWQDIPAEEQQPQIPATGRKSGNWIDLPSANVRPAAIGAISANPERTAQDFLLAQRYKTTPSLVGSARSTFEERAAADDAAGIMTGAPKLSDWYTRVPENAALAKDDLHNSADLERLLESIRPDYLRGVKLPELVFPKALPKTDGSTWDRTKRAWVEGQAGNRIATHGFLQIPLDGLSELFPSLFGDLAEANRDEIRGYREWIKNTPYTSANGGAKVWEDFVRSSPQMATQISLGVLSGGIAVPTTFMGTQIAGSQYADLTEDGVNGGRAFLAALGNTAMQLPMEAIQMNKFMNIFKSSGLGQIAKNVGEAALTSFITETLQNYPEALTTLWAQSTQAGQNPMKQFMDNLGQYTLEGMYEGALSIPWALLGGSGRIAYDIGRYRTLNRDVEFFTALDDNAAASKMKARLPQAYQSLVDHLTANGPVQNLYISPAAMRLVIPDENVLYQTASDMGVTQEQFIRAEELGADIEVPLNLYQGKIAGTDVSLALRGEVRTSPEGMTLAEQTAFAENFRQQVETAVSEYRDSLLQDDDLNTVLAPIEEELASLYGKEGARANVALLRARANLAAQAWKDAGRDITPAQWLQDVAKLRVAVREQGQGQIGDLQHAAMIRATDATVADFARRVSTVNESKKSYFEMTPGQGIFSGVSVRLPADTIRHKNRRHPDMTDTDMERLPQVLSALTTEQAGYPQKKMPRYGGEPVFGWAVVDGQTYGVVLEAVAADRALVTTYFKDDAAGIRSWFEQNTNKEKAVTTPAPLQLGQASNEDVLRNQPSSDENIAPGETGVNEDGSGELFQAAPPVESGAFKKWFGDSKVVGENGDPLVVWHQTGEDIEAFDIRKKGAGEFDNLLPSGVFMKPSDADIGLEGKLQMPLYAKIENPFRVTDRTALKKYLSANIDGYAELQEQAEAIDAEHLQAYDALEEEAYRRFEAEWEPNNPDATPDERGVAIDAFFEDVGLNALADKWHEAGTAKSAQMKELVEQHFKASEYDGIILDRDEGGIGKKTTKTFIAFDPAQVKSVNNIGTFDPSDPRIMYAGQDGARGSISFQHDETLISLFKDSADFSTFIHEIGHLFVRDMENIVATGKASEQVIKDLESLKAFTAEFSNPETLRSFYDSTFRKQRPIFREKDFSSLSEPELALVKEVAEQEKLADAFVTYISEGKAPSAELRPVFQRFRIWLQKLYQALSGQVAINDEIRGVFDRMLASDQDIQLAERIHHAQATELQALDTVAQNMLTEQEQARLLKARQAAESTSREQRLKKVLRAYYKAGANRSEIRKQAVDTVNAMPVYAAQDQAITEGGLNSEAIRDEYGADVANALLKKRPGLLRKEGTVSLQDLAVAHGFANEEELIGAIRNAPGKKVETNALVKSEIAAREEAIRQELGLDDSANSGDFDYYSNQRLEALELEVRALTRASGERQKGRTFGTAETLRTLARRMLESMPYRETANIGRLSAAEAKQAARAAQATAEGNMDAAADAKRRQAINHAMVLEALQYRHEAEVFTRALKRYAKSERMVFEYQEQIRAMAERYKLAPGISPRKPGERASLREFIENNTADSVYEAPPFSDFITSERVPENITLSEMREIRDVVRWLAAEGNPEEAKLLSEGISGTVADTVKVGVETLQSSGNKFTPKDEGTLARSGQDKWQDTFAGLDHIKFMMMAADGYKEIGKNSHLAGFHSKWFQRVMEAQTKFLSMFRTTRPELDRISVIRTEFVQRFEKQLGKKVEEINGIRTPEVMREVGRRHWTAEHIWCLARNMGNAGNLKTLHEGFGLSDADLRGLTSVLNKNEWMAIQAEGDLIGKHFAETDTVFRQIYGRPMPDAVEHLPFSVVTAEGETLELSGWYFPISIDGRLNPEVGDKQEIDLAKSSPDFVAYGPSLAKGFTKGRTGTGRPVGLYFGVLDTALQDQWRFMTMAPVIRDMDRITRNKEWRKAYTSAFGTAYYSELRSWLKYVARPVTERGDVLDSFIDNQRKLATVFTLGLNTSTFIRQFQGYFHAAPDLGAKWILKGIFRAAHNPMALVRNINEQSPFLADRDKNFVRELRKSLVPPNDIIKLNVGGKIYTREDIQEVAMTLVTLGDRLTTYPIWQGAYIKATEELNMGRDDAISYANSIIQKTQASNTEADLNRWQREGGKSWKRLFSMFMSESLRKGSRMRYYWRAYQQNTISIGEYVNHLCMESVAPALFYVALRALLTSSEPEPDDIAEQIFSELTGPLPFISQIWSVLSYKGGWKSMMDSPAFRGIQAAEDLGKSIVKIAQRPTSSASYAAFFKSLVDVVAFSLGTGNVRRMYETAAQGWHDLEGGKTVNPFRLFFRAPKK